MSSLTKFGVIGLTALVIHWLVAVLATEQGIIAGWANLLGFVVAFQFSSHAHYGWTFQRADVGVKASETRRYLVVAAGGFLVNEILYESLPQFVAIDYRLLLLLVLLGVGAGSFLFCRFWAFR